MRVGLAPEHRRASAVPALAGQARGLDDTAVARRAGLPGFCSQRKVGHHVGVPPMLLASPSSLAHARLEGRRSPSSAAVGPLRRARRLRAALFRRARRAASVLQPGPHRKKGRAVRAPWPCEGRFGGAASEARPTEAVQEGPRRQGCQGTLGGCPSLLCGWTARLRTSGGGEGGRAATGTWRWAVTVVAGAPVGPCALSVGILRPSGGGRRWGGGRLWPRRTPQGRSGRLPQSGSVVALRLAGW
ncbi:unnamed protein product, partial [Prorocentrum cordatum]